MSDPTVILPTGEVVSANTIDWTTHYLHDGVVTEYPSKPNPYCTFDYTNQVWVQPASLHDAMIDALKIIRDEKLLLGVSWSGNTYPTDDDTRMKFAAAAVAYNYLSISPPLLPQSGVDTHILGGYLSNIVSAQEVHYQAVWTNFNTLKVAIDNAADDAALLAIDLSVGWP